MASHGSFHWNEVHTNDAGGSRKFYTDLLGWTTQTMPMPEGGEYTLWLAGGQPVAGMYPMTGGEGDFDRPQWVAYITVDDVDATLARVGELGGAIHMPAMDVAGVGRFAIIQDPQGAMIGLITPAQEA